MTLFHCKQLGFIGAMACLLALPFSSGCSNSSDDDQNNPAEDNVMMNQLQYLGTHNSYHLRVREDIFDLLLV
ncbi:MAG: hypothetical protein ACKVHM_10760, partial [Pseudomonadales bacterium]